MTSQIMINHRHFEEALQHEFYEKWIGGRDRAEKLKLLMEEKEPELPVCPFCGAPAVLQGVWTYATPGIRVRCSCCHCSTPLVVEGLNLTTNHKVTLEEALFRVMNLWSAREGGEAST